MWRSIFPLAAPLTLLLLGVAATALGGDQPGGAPAAGDVPAVDPPAVDPPAGEHPAGEQPAGNAKPDQDAIGSINVDMIGIIHGGIMAIGGETTGSTVTALGITWELDCGGKPELEQFVARHDGEEVSVRGTITVKHGVERGQRIIVKVAKFSELVN